MTDHECEACGLEYRFVLTIKTPLHTQEGLVTISPPADFMKVCCPRCGQGGALAFDEETE
jgi:uncharacterized protein (DUF983 family)